MKVGLGIAFALLVFGGVAAWAQVSTSGSRSDRGAVRSFTFDTSESLSGWTVTGDVTIDPAKGREGTGGALKIAPGGKAELKLRNRDQSGKLELWVYDDGSKPQNPRASHVGPRWGLVESDGKALTVGVLYASYLGGDEGYSASAYAGGSWFDCFWLGMNRAPVGWHKWTLAFDPTTGIHIVHNDVAVDASHFDNTKAGLKGFNAVAIWGDEGGGGGQTIWVDDVTLTPGGPVRSVPVAAPTVQGPDPWVPSGQKVVMYTKDHPPATPKLTDLARQRSVSQYGITWTFDKPARVGHFVNGDWYVVDPVTVVAIDPKPLYGTEIPDVQLDVGDKDHPVDQRVRNGFMLNPPAAMKVAYDSGVHNWFDPSLIQKLPVAMKPGDSLVSTISMPKGLVLKAQLTNEIERGVGDSSPIRTAAVLTCMAAPQPPDAFRPAFCDRTSKVYLSRNLRRDLLPRVTATKSAPDVALYARFTQRPWVGTGFFGFEEPVENMPQYAREYGRVVGTSALLLCTDLKPEQKETLLVNYVQVGIDLGGMVRAGHPGWTGFGGHGSGRKLPIVFAGLLLGDQQLANINKSFPKVSFGEDEQTAYGDCWTGAKVVFAGHSGIDVVTGEGRSRDNGWGPYEHTQPNAWKEGPITSEAYRRCCTSMAWVAQALALHLMKAETAWDHPAFFDYVDRWMYESDAQFVQAVKDATGHDFSDDWERQGQAYDAFLNEMWAAHRSDRGLPPTDGWKQQHDDSYYRHAVELMEADAANKAK
ncbi:MAG: hypothetical protein ABSD48_20255 [Armatimonadota bacterium]